MHHGRPVSSRLMPPYTHLGGYIAKVDGRTEYQSVGPGNLFQITKKQAHEVLRSVPLLRC